MGLMDALVTPSPPAVRFVRLPTTAPIKVPHSGFLATPVVLLLFASLGNGCAIASQYLAPLCLVRVLASGWGRYRCALHFFLGGHPIPPTQPGWQRRATCGFQRALLLVIRHASSVVCIRFYRGYHADFASFSRAFRPVAFSHAVWGLVLLLLAVVRVGLGRVSGGSCGLRRSGGGQAPGHGGVSGLCGVFWCSVVRHSVPGSAVGVAGVVQCISQCLPGCLVCLGRGPAGPRPSLIFCWYPRNTNKTKRSPPHFLSSFLCLYPFSSDNC